MVKNYFFSVCLILSCGSASAQSGDGILTEAEQMPYYPGCEHLKNGTDEKRNCSNLGIVNYIANNLKYPPTAQAAGIEGTVYVGFEINESGNVSRAFLLKTIDEACGREALRVIQSMPKWQPAINGGKAVKVQLHIPIHFYLKDDQLDKASTCQINWGGLAARRVTLKQLENNLNKKIMVRDKDGNELYCSELIFTYEKKSTVLQEKSNGSINNAVEKMIRKIKAGGTFSIIAIVQEKGEFIEVEKVFEVVEE